MGPLNALCRPIFQRRNLTPILFCKHTHGRSGEIPLIWEYLLHIPERRSPMFQNFWLNQTLRTDLVLKSWVQLTTACPRTALRPVGLRPSWQRGADTIIYYRPQVHPANLLQPFSAFCKKWKQKKIPSSSTSLGYIRATLFHLLPKRICGQFILL